MVSGWATKRVLITVRTYPVPAQKGIEVSCTAGVAEDGQWMRIFPVPYRFLDPDQRFQKYQWIEVSAKRPNGDTRPESYTINAATIKVQSSISTADGWRARKTLLEPLIRPSMCHIARTRDERGFPTLGLFRPARIRRLLIAKAAPDWTTEQKAILSQQLLAFQKGPSQQLEKIPFDFRYEFECHDPSCNGHNMMCTDWEMAASYRSWRDQYGDRWEEKFREKYERQMTGKLDTHLYVGTTHGHPKSWIIVGLFYPPKQSMDDLFG
jgi:hypothetical protein